jgi:hypothetical protein
MTEPAKSIGRRELMCGGAVAALAVGAAAVVPFVAKADGSGELTGLIRVYRERMAVFNHGPELSAANKVMDGLRKMLVGMIGVPVQSSAEAVAAIDFVFEDSKGCMIDFTSRSGRAYAWLLQSARDYIASQVRS